jgi:hypothetical protein
MLGEMVGIKPITIAGFKKRKPVFKLLAKSNT